MQACAHIPSLTAGRVTIYQTISEGGVVYFVRRSDMSTLFEDFARAKPTKTMMVVRVEGEREGGRGREGGFE